MKGEGVCLAAGILFILTALVAGNEPSIQVDNGDLHLNVNATQSICFNQGNASTACVADFLQHQDVNTTVPSLAMANELSAAILDVEHVLGTYITANELPQAAISTTVEQIADSLSSFADAALTADISTNLETFRTTVNSALDTLAQSLADMQTDVNEVKGDVTNMGARVGALEDKLSDHCGRVCYPGEYVSSPCTDSQKTTCSPCSEGTYSPGGLLQECLQCTPCDPKTQYQTAPCTASANTVCATCAECQTGISFAADTTQCDASGNHCTPCSTCSRDEFKESSCSPLQDTVCKPCGSCADGEYLISRCTPLEPAKCAACTPCATGEQEVSPCTATSDRVCQSADYDGNGGGWIKFWWFEGRGFWPHGETDVLGKAFGECDPDEWYCFGRLPEWVDEMQLEMLAMDREDGSNTKYIWRFDPSNPTAHAAFRAFRDHIPTQNGWVVHRSTWNPYSTQGTITSQNQDSFQYRPANGIWSLQLDDDNGYCHTTLEMGWTLSGSGVGSQIGVELADNGCNQGRTTNTMFLYFRKAAAPLFGGGWKPFWWFNRYMSANGVSDMLGSPYGSCQPTDPHCFGRIDPNQSEANTELLVIDDAGTVVKYAFSPAHPVAHAVWQSMVRGQMYNAGQVVHAATWNYATLQGNRHETAQDSWMYREACGVRSFLLDDDNCYCLTTLEAGMRMCGSGCDSYFGVDNVFDSGCNYVSNSKNLMMYFRTV
eukprot:m.19629 g.19629  ORF g.19629 m.19629 type:complete len:717 (-) comp8058_c0_seq3:100-2250(-)